MRAVRPGEHGQVFVAATVVRWLVKWLVQWLGRS